jgi:hypothetical protein
MAASPITVLIVISALLGEPDAVRSTDIIAET